MSSAAMAIKVHPTAVVDPKAQLAEGVEIGPYAVIGPEVQIGRGSRIGPHVVIDGRVRLGERNRIFPGACIGLEPQDLKYNGAPTEVVLGDSDGVQASYSADIGCVRMTERCLHSDPPTAAEVAAAREVVRERLAEALRVVPVEQAKTWVGVAGTFTTIAALTQGMDTYDSDAIHLSRIRFSDMLAVCDQLLGMTREQRAALGPMHEGRVDVIGGGAIVVQELAAALGERAGIDELVVSEHDILDGIALSIPSR